MALNQGYAEAANWLKLKRVKTVWEWLRLPEVAVFLKETGRGNGSWEEAPRRIKVCLGEPMTEQYQEKVSEILMNCTPGASDIYSSPVPSSGVGESVIHSVGAPDTHNGVNGTHKRGASVTPVGADGTHSIGPSGTLDWGDWHRLSSLTPGLKRKVNTQTTTTICADEVEVGEWQMAKMLSRNRVSAKNKKFLLEKGAAPQAFISWLLYGASNNGASIRDPIGHTVSRLAKDPAKGAGGSFDRLANLTSQDLAELIRQELNGQTPWRNDWKTAMDGASRTRLLVLVKISSDSAR